MRRGSGGNGRTKKGRPEAAPKLTLLFGSIFGSTLAAGAVEGLLDDREETVDANGGTGDRVGYSGLV